MLICKGLHEVRIRQNVRHCLGNHFPAGLIIAKTTFLLLLNQEFHILATLG